MPLEWLGGSREPSLPDLIARRKYGRAIEMLTQQLRRETPTVKARLQLADLMVQAGRSSEAVPVFLELADEFARDGFVAKAIAIVKRVDRIAPGTEVDERLEELVRTQRRLGAQQATPVPLSPMPAFGLEVIPDEEPVLEVEPVLEAEPEAEPIVEPEPIEVDEAEPVVEPDPVAGIESLVEAEPIVEAEPVDEATPGPAQSPQDPSAEPSSDEVAGAGVGQRIRGAFRRLLGSLPTGTIAAAEAAVAGAEDEEPIEVEASELAFGGEEALSEAAFQGQLLDAIQGAISHPLPRGAVAGSTTLAPGQRLVATPLFGTLDEAELLAVVRGLRLRTFRPGDIILSEGELGEQSLFVISSGRVKVFVRGPSGRNVQLGSLGEGDFFGEMSGVSGRPRAATITAAEDCELLQLPKARVDEIARRHPRVREQLDQHFVERASSPEAAAVRAVPIERSSALEARAVLSAHFGEARWDPRMRLRLARLLVQAGKEDDALPVLLALADELCRAGHTAKAVAVIKKVEQIQSRHVQEILLAPLHRPVVDQEVDTETGDEDEPDRDAFQAWLVDMVRDRVTRTPPPSPQQEAPRGYGGLQASPLFAGFSEEELVALFQGFSLRRGERGDVLVTEGERGEGLFVLCTGRVRVWVRDPRGRDVELCELTDGAFFGEISMLSGRPRSATVCAATDCDLLELDRRALDALTRQHPRVRRVLEEFVAARSASADAARIRGHSPSDGES